MPVRHLQLGLLAASLVLFGTSCPDNDPTSPDGSLVPGTWGGENVGMIIEEDVVHVHVGCTFGDFPAPITLDDDNRFSVTGSYVLRAYPVQIGPSLPAQFAGVRRGREITFTVAVNDTVEKKLVVLGPSQVEFGKEPRMGPCPICVQGQRVKRKG